MSRINYEKIKNVIIDLLSETNKNKDRAYANTVLRILHSNPNSVVASKYKNKYFYGLYKDITFYQLRFFLDKMVKDNVLISQPGKNNNKYYNLSLDLPVNEVKITKKEEEFINHLISK